jgi:hypothetical protein
MLIQTAERAWKRECEEAGGYWPRNALDLWWRSARRVPDREMLALRLLDEWRAHTTYRLSSFLRPRHMLGFLEGTGALAYARCLDRLSVAPLFSFSLYRNQRANYLGAAGQVVRASDSATSDLAFTPTKVLDVASLMTHAGVSSEVLAAAYDQGPVGVAHNFTATGTARPRMVNAGVLDVTTGGNPTAFFDGSNDMLAGPTPATLGISGSPALTMCQVVKWTAAGSYSFGLGHGNANAGWRFGAGVSTTIFADNAPGTSRRTFGPTLDVTTQERTYTAGKALNATVSAFTASQGGVTTIPQSAITGGTAALSLGSALTRWMAVSNSVGAPAGFAGGRSNYLTLFGSVLSGADQFIVEQEMFLHL